MRRHENSALCFYSRSFLFAVLLSSPLSAQEQALERTDEIEKLDSEIASGKTRLDALSSQAAELAERTHGLQAELIAAAAQVQTHEGNLTELEQRYSMLQAREDAVAQRLEGRRETLADLLAALESLASHSAPALGVSPADAAQAARSAMLLNDLIPKLHEASAKLERELAELKGLREKVRGEQRAIAAEARRLEEKRATLATLLDSMEKRRSEVMESAKAEQVRLSLLAAQASDLRSLLNSLTSGIAVAMPRPKPNALVTAQAALNPGRGFAALRGKLKAPVAGDFTPIFHAGASAKAVEGLAFGARPGAQVVSPCDGSIAFAGNYLDYGLLLIIATGDGYHILLSGMGRIDAVVGQRLLAGEPVGRMGEGGPGGQSQSAPELYFEVRHNGEPVDPVPWLAISDRKASG